MAHEKLIKLLETQLKLEKESARALRKEMKTIDHVGIKALFEICAADSTKHAAMVQLMLDALKEGELSKETFVSSWQQRNQGLEAIKTHIEREQKMIELLKDEILVSKDETLKVLLKHILDDEKRHHTILKDEVWKF
ncbi:MAG: ferritin family protein [Candidatus Hodarchaeota archaeon]